MAVTINGSAGVTTNTGAVYDSLQRGTAVTASGTSVDFTGIPSWVKRITVMFSGVSTNGTSNWLVRTGSGSIVATGYSSSSSYFVAGGVSTQADTTGFLIRSDNAANVISGAMVIYNVSGNLWMETWFGGNGPNTQTHLGGGNITLSGTLDRIRITTVNGTDTFDAGTINIIYE